jgi:hypothetical protein
MSQLKRHPATKSYEKATWYSWQIFYNALGIKLSKYFGLTHGPDHIFHSIYLVEWNFYGLNPMLGLACGGYTYECTGHDEENLFICKCSWTKKKVHKFRCMVLVTWWFLWAGIYGRERKYLLSLKFLHLAISSNIWSILQRLPDWACILGVEYYPNACHVLVCCLRESVITIMMSSLDIFMEKFIIC